LLALVNQHGIKASDAADHEPATGREVQHSLRTSATALKVGPRADVYIDENGDGVMDISTTTRSDFRRHQDLSDLAEEIDEGSAEDDGSLVGGLGVYRARKNHGPFVHVDVRGYMARWGG